MRLRKKAEGAKGKILVAEDPKKAHMAKCEREGGIRYHPNLIQSMNELADKLEVAQMKTKW